MKHMKKAMEYLIYTKFYETKIMTYSGFKKMHPHDSDSIIRIAYREPVDKSIIKKNIQECLHAASEIYTVISSAFKK